MIGERSSWQRDAYAHLPRVIVFSEIARLGSLSAAARALGLSRSTVSAQLGALEEALGIRLLERSTRSISLTEAGRAFLAATAPILSAWQDAQQQTQSRLDEPQGTLTITAPALLTNLYLMPAIRLFGQRYPRADIDLRISPANLDLLQEGVDLAIRSGPLADSGLGATVLLRGTHIVVAAPEVASSWPAQHITELERAPWVDHTTRRPMPTLTGADGNAVSWGGGDVRLRVDTTETFIAALIQGCGFGLIPDFAVRDQLEQGALVNALPHWAPEPITIYAVTPSARPKNARVTAFLSILRAQLSAPA